MRLKYNTLSFVCGFIAAIVIIAGVCCLYSDGKTAENRDTQSLSSSAEIVATKPMIVWFHNIATTKPKVLEKAISNGIVSHVLLLYLHPLDAPLKGPALVKVREAVEVCKKYKTKIIWCRTLWPTYKVEDIRKDSFFSPNYYITAIEQVKLEAKNIEADFTAIDTEPYGYFPFKSEFRKAWSDKDFNAVVQAIKEATAKEGQVDFVLPSYGPFKNHIYNALVELGKWKIAEHTYFDIPAKIKDKKRPYDVLGAYVNISKKNVKVPSAPFFTPEEILQRQELWARKKGLMLYPYEGNVEKVAEMITKISNIQSHKKGNDSK